MDMPDIKKKYQPSLNAYAPIALVIFLAVGLLGCENNNQNKVVDFSKRISEDVELSGSKKDKTQGEALLFGFDLRSSIQEDARQYQPLLNYLENETGYTFQLVLASKDDHLDKKLGNSKIDFAAIGAVTYINSKESHNIHPVVRGLNDKNKAEYQSLIVVHPDSDINNIGEIKGKSFAFGNESSTQGHLIPRIELLNHEIPLNELAEYEYFGSHRNCASAVISRKFDACGMQDTMARELESEGLIRVLYTSEYYPSSGIAASPNVDKDIIEKVRQALIRFDPKGAQKNNLYNWDKTEMANGFKSATEDDYLQLRESMLQIGLLSKGN